MVNKNIIKKAKFLAPYMRGRCVDLASEDINWDTNLHRYVEKATSKKIVRVDKFGKPDIRVDFNLPFSSKIGKYDTILSSEMIEHLENPVQFLRECKKSLAENGRIILTTPNACSLAEMQSSLFIKHHNKEYVEHIYSWNKHNMITLAGEAGLKIKEFKYISFYWKKNYLFRFVAWLIPMLRPNMFVVLVPEKKQ